MLKVTEIRSGLTSSALHFDLGTEHPAPPAAPSREKPGLIIKLNWTLLSTGHARHALRRGDLYTRFPAFLPDFIWVASHRSHHK